MATTKDWLVAFRLRTLPLALSSIILGSMLAFGTGLFSWPVAILATTTTLFLQILSNLANDYGDSESGVDNENRVGPSRSVQGGAISSSEMKRAIIVFVVLSLLSGIGLIVVGTVHIGWEAAALFLILGVGAIAAAIKYTVGKTPYGYQGLGDLFVLIFFGWVGVCGTYFLHTNQFDWVILLPATSVGLLSVAVLNLNNMRDQESDAASGKHTLVVRMGARAARIYHVVIITVALFSAVAFVMLRYHSSWQWLFLLALPPLVWNVLIVLRQKETHKLDPELKKVALSTLLFAITFGIGAIC